MLSGYDLYRIARRLGLSPRIVAGAFCKSYLAPQTLLPALRLTPDPRTGNCRFFEGSACAIHAARPLACALYPRGHSIDPVTAKIEYYGQTPPKGEYVMVIEGISHKELEKQSIQEWEKIT